LRKADRISFVRIIDYFHPGRADLNLCGAVRIAMNDLQRNSACEA
jgi:hypothetical protein